MDEPALDSPGVVALIGQRVAAGVPQHMGMGLELFRSIIRAKPAVVKGEPRSLTNTKGEDGHSYWGRRQRPGPVEGSSFGPGRS